MLGYLSLLLFGLVNSVSLQSGFSIIAISCGFNPKSVTTGIFIRYYTYPACFLPPHAHKFRFFYLFFFFYFYPYAPCKRALARGGKQFFHHTKGLPSVRKVCAVVGKLQIRASGFFLMPLLLSQMYSSNLQ